MWSKSREKYQIQSELHNELLTFYQILVMPYLQNNSHSTCTFIKIRWKFCKTMTCEAKIYCLYTYYCLVHLTGRKSWNTLKTETYFYWNLISAQSSVHISVWTVSFLYSLVTTTIDKVVTDLYFIFIWKWGLLAVQVYILKSFCCLHFLNLINSTLAWIKIIYFVIANTWIT